MVPIDFQRALRKFSKVLVDSSTECLAELWNKGLIVVPDRILPKWPLYDH